MLNIVYFALNESRVCWQMKQADFSKIPKMHLNKLAHVLKPFPNLVFSTNS